MTEYVGLFFIFSNCSIQSTFPLFLQNFSMRCFRCGKKNTVQELLEEITRSLNNNFTLESTPSRIFLLSFDFFFFFYYHVQL